MTDTTQAMMKAERVLSRHDPEREIDTSPTAPPVTWAEAALAQALLESLAEIEDMREEITRLNAAVTKLLAKAGIS